MKVGPGTQRRGTSTGPVARRGLSRLISIGLFYVGFSAAIDRAAPDFGGLFSLNLAVALGLGWLGWHGLEMWPALRTYYRYATALSIWFCMSSIAAWDLNAFSWSILTAVRLLYIVPGIANLVRDVTHRKALFVGIFGAAMTYALTGLGRLAVGREVFDLPDPSRAVLLGVKRGFVNSRLLYVIPFLVNNAPRILPKLRWAGAAALVAGVVVSGGRAGLLGLAFIVLVLALVRPGASQKVRAIVVAVLLGLTFVTAISEFGGQAVVGKNRLVAFVRGERTSSEDIREAQFKRAWHAGWANPAFGVGPDGLRGLRDDDSFQGVKHLGSRENAIRGGTHNSYIQVFAEFGVPGLLGFLLLFVALLRAAWRERERPEMQAVIAAFASMMLTMLFHAMSLAFAYYPLAFLVGALGDRRFGSGGDGARRAPELGTSGTSVRL
ncbi:MAG: O-antigen ligase family protein [Actinomycetota bacterium]